MKVPTCHFCGDAPAPFRYRPSGLMSDLPENLRGKYARACVKAECRVAAEKLIKSKFTTEVAA